VRQLLSACPAEEHLDRSFRLRGLEQDGREPQRRPGGDEAFVELARELDSLLRGGDCNVQIADGERDD
jgi:hypothetical protein